jgi:hypothetical protein
MNAEGRDLAWSAIGARNILNMVKLIPVVCGLMGGLAIHAADTTVDPNGRDQVPDWSAGDLDFFLHGSMSTEVVPETVLGAFMDIYPDLFPTKDLRHLGLIPDSTYGWPIGFSRTNVPHLGGLSAIGLNCASCHVGDITAGGAKARVLGMTSHFDAEAFFGAVIVGTFRTAQPENMQKFLAAVAGVNKPPGSSEARGVFDARWDRQRERIEASLREDPSGAKGIAAGALHAISNDQVRLQRERLAQADLVETAHSFMKLFHNMRTSLHVPDQPPDKAPPSSGPGRNDAFGLLSAALFGVPQPYAPVKYGLVWNVENRQWVHWDGNTRSPLGRNMLAALGLGAPLLGKHAQLDFTLVKRQTDLSERIRPPKYPFALDRDLAARGESTFKAHCASCHDGKESDARLFETANVGTQPTRAEAFTQKQADMFNEFLAGIETPGYQALAEPAIRGTQKYWAATLAGVWARSPYLHNGSVRTMRELLTHPEQRAKTFHRGSREYETAQMGYADGGAYVLDTTVTANSNAGHNYGTELSSEQKNALLEYLKTL